MFVSVKKYAKKHNKTRQAVLYMIKAERFEDGEIQKNEKCDVCGATVKFLVDKNAEWPKNLNCGKRG